MNQAEVTKKYEKHLLSNTYNHMIMAGAKRKFKIGDHVRISKIRGVLDKKYMLNGSTEIFQVKKVQLTYPTTYVLGGFYENNCKKGSIPKSLVEKIIRKKGDKVVVK